MSARLLLAATVALAVVAGGCRDGEAGPPVIAVDSAPAGRGSHTAAPPPVAEAPSARAEPAHSAGTRREPDAMFTPTPPQVIDKMLELAEVKPTDVVYDLGCGDGRIVVAVAKRYGARAYGFDIDPRRVAESRANVRRAGVEALVTIEQRDIFTVDLAGADVVTLYLTPEVNAKLLPQLRRLAPGARVVSHDHPMPGVPPLVHVEMMKGHKHVYLWRAPLVLDGAPSAEPAR